MLKTHTTVAIWEITLDSLGALLKRGRERERGRGRGRGRERVYEREKER